MPIDAIVGRQAAVRGSAEQPRRQSVPIVKRPAHAGNDFTWEGTGNAIQVDETDTRGRNLLAVNVEGDCMAPDVLPGDLVLFDQWDRNPKDRAMVVVSAHNQTHVRWLRLTRPEQPEFVDNNGVRLLAPEITLEGTVFQVIRRRPRRRDWHDLD